MKELINWLEDNGFDFFTGIQNSLTYKGKNCYFTISSGMWGISLQVSRDLIKLETPPIGHYEQHLLANYAETLYRGLEYKLKTKKGE